MSHLFRASFILAAALALAVPVFAQEGPLTQAGSDTVTAAAPSAEVVPNSGPTLASLDFAVPAPRMAFDAPSAFAVQPNRQNVALMVVGGAGLLVGAVIGGDEGTIIMIAGGGIGLLGLWRYLR